jgi:hypothetical protein
LLLQFDAVGTDQSGKEMISSEKHVWKSCKGEPSSSSSHEASADDAQMKENRHVKDQKQSRRTCNHHSDARLRRDGCRPRVRPHADVAARDADPTGQNPQFVTGRGIDGASCDLPSSGCSDDERITN